MVRLFSIIGSVGFFLAFAILAACSDDSPSSSDPKDSSSSSAEAAVSGEPIPGDGTVSIDNFDVTLDGPKHEKLVIEASVAATGSKTLSKVDVKVNGNLKKSYESGKSHRIDYTYNFNGEEYCDGKDYEVWIEAYVDNAINQRDIKKYKRDVGKCKTAQESSSSAAQTADKPFVKVGPDLIALSTKDNKGVVLSTGTATPSTSEADIYLDAGGVLKTSKSNVTIIDKFYKESTENYGTLRENAVAATSTKNFIFRESDAESAVNISVPYYYLVRTSGTAEWDNSCYLILIVSEQSGNGTAEIKIWTVQ